MKTHSKATRRQARWPALALLVGTLFSAVAFMSAPAQARGRHHSSHGGYSHHRVHGYVHHAGQRSSGMPYIGAMRRSGRHTGRAYRVSAQMGIASVYHTRFQGRRMADGGRFNIWSNNAASRTLPLGTVALVTNLDNGLSSRVEIRDRGPYVGHRVCDLSPGTAHRLGMHKPGLMHIRLTPLRIPV